ncbi:hypothetical protein B0H63DRAFT_362420, partial [Podospora didyma]
MATLLAPYNTAMQLGSGFNSFTQQLCINNAVVRERQPQESAVDVDKPRLPIAQEVVYKTAVIDKVTDVTSAMNINAAFAIKYDTFDAKGKGDFINTSKVKESDVSFMIAVKVVNQVIYDNLLTKFDPIPDVKLESFASVYGDSFISGFQEGGEFIAVISVRAKDRQKASSMRADAAINFTKENMLLDANGEFSKKTKDFLEQNETTVSVTYSGGGQDLKKPDADWTLETMRSAALKFPELVAQTPLRTHAILTKYTSLRSFQAVLGKVTDGNHNAHTVIPNFELAGVYTSVLQEAYLDYKNILKNLQVTTYNVSHGIERLVDGPTARRLAVQTPSATAPPASAPGTAPAAAANGESDDDSSVVAVDTPKSKLKASIYTDKNEAGTKPYPPTIAGLEAARQDVRFMLNRIVGEVDAITAKPELAVDEGRELCYVSPFIFKDLLP